MAPKPTCECGTCQKCKWRAYMRDWYRRPGNAEAQCESQRASRLKRLDSVRAYDRERGRRYSSPEKESARAALNRAIKRGEIVRGECEVGVDCIGRIEGHHEDYSKPLDVRWLCRKHHGMVHREVAA